MKRNANAVGVLPLAEVRSGLKRIEFQVHFLSCGTPPRVPFLCHLHARGIDYYSKGAGTRDGRCRADAAGAAVPKYDIRISCAWGKWL